MLLIYNTIINDSNRQLFDYQTAPHITFHIPYEIVHVGEKLPCLDKFSHLLLTGSSLSASQGSTYDQEILSLIRFFYHEKKAILGICHGHQMIARALADDSVCCRATKPEFGWKKMRIKKNIIFKDVSQAIFLESHYDEVKNLPDDFSVIAENDMCSVQAFQYKKLPIWGLQFHPEMLKENGNDMVESHLLQHPEDRIFYKNELKNPEKIKDNLNIFKNFLHR